MRVFAALWCRVVGHKVVTSYVCNRCQRCSEYVPTVFSRAECSWAYCPTPDMCQQKCDFPCSRNSGGTVDG